MGFITAFAVWGNSITDVLNVWADMGVFAYALPFLLIFAVIFGILIKSGVLGDNKGVITVIALAIGLLSLQFDFVPNLFATLFPYAGMGIAILLVFLILTALFVNPGGKSWQIVYFSVGAVIALIVVISSLSDYGWGGSGWWDNYWPMIVAILIIAGLIAVVVAASKGVATTVHQAS